MLTEIERQAEEDSAEITDRANYVLRASASGYQEDRAKRAEVQAAKEAEEKRLALEKVENARRLRRPALLSTPEAAPAPTAPEPVTA